MLRALLLVVFCVCIGCGGSENQAAVETPPPAAVPAPVTKVVEPQGSAPHVGIPPEIILFPSEYGNVTFGHQKHFERVNNDCATCHPKIFPQAREALNYGKARHRVAEEYKTSCATCHGIKGTAFAAERNCQRCHDMGLPKH